MNFKEIPGIESWLACDNGKIYSKPLKRFLVGRLIKGYVQVGRQDGDKVKLYRAHILICSAFNGLKPNEDYQVNHKNGIKDDNRPENLEWCSCRDNVIHSLKNRLRKTKLTPDQVNTIRQEFKSRTRNFGDRYLAKKYGVNRTTIWAIGNNHSHKFLSHE